MNSVWLILGAFPFLGIALLCIVVVVTMLALA